MVATIKFSGILKIFMIVDLMFGGITFDLRVPILGKYSPQRISNAINDAIVTYSDYLV